MKGHDYFRVPERRNRRRNRSQKVALTKARPIAVGTRNPLSGLSRAWTSMLLSTYKGSISAMERMTFRPGTSKRSALWRVSPVLRLLPDPMVA